MLNYISLEIRGAMLYFHKCIVYVVPVVAHAWLMHIYITIFFLSSYTEVMKYVLL